MVQIDWGELRPTLGQRARVAASLERVDGLEGSVIALCQRGARFEARLFDDHFAVTELRLQDDDLGAVVDRALALLLAVSRDDGPARA